MTTHFADALFEAIEKKGSPVCVGLDPVYENLPVELKAAEASPDWRAQAITEFCRAVIEAVSPHVPAVKPQIAYFERYGPAGLAGYYRTVATAKSAGLMVIGDVKRGDIGSTAEAYAAAHLSPPAWAAADPSSAAAPDAITVNGYFGLDGTEPFIRAAQACGAGVFVLVRTSNPGGAAIQDFRGPKGKRFFVHLAEQVAKMGEGEGMVGECGYSCVGAVVGATYPREARALRKVMPRQIFLVPGYGSQGATAKDCAAAFDKRGQGAIVNASRSVIYAFARRKAVAWRKAIGEAAREFAADIAGAVKR